MNTYQMSPTSPVKARSAARAREGRMSSIGRNWSPPKARGLPAGTRSQTAGFGRAIPTMAGRPKAVRRYSFDRLALDGFAPNSLDLESLDRPRAVRARRERQVDPRCPAAGPEYRRLFANPTCPRTRPGCQP